MLEKKEETGRIKKKGLISFFANTLLIIDNNPTPGSPLRVAAAAFVRPAQASFFNLMWKTIFEGIKTTVGFTSEREQELQKSFDSMKAKSTRPERAERREERRQKREERRQTKDNR